jgi:ABC-type antimicrobial peptide transport system permease subunit
MEFLAARDTASLSFTMLALLVSAGMALLLGAVGLYGVLSYVVSQRTREIGIRLALGARQNEVRRMTVIEGVRTVSFGLALGLLGAAALTRLLGGLLYGTEPLDPLTYIVVTACMLGVSVLASWVPARRASAVDPMRSMRVE